MAKRWLNVGLEWSWGRHKNKKNQKNDKTKNTIKPKTQKKTETPVSHLFLICFSSVSTALLLSF